MTEVAEFKCVDTKRFVGVRVFDFRRYGTLFQRYRRSKVWTIPVLQAATSESNLFDLMHKVIDSLPVTGSRKIISATTLFETTSYVDLQEGAENGDYEAWDMVVYHVDIAGQFESSLSPNDKNFDGRAFVPYGSINSTLKTFNEITARFLKAMEKQKCLR